MCHGRSKRFPFGVRQLEVLMARHIDERQVEKMRGGQGDFVAFEEDGNFGLFMEVVEQHGQTGLAALP